MGILQSSEPMELPEALRWRYVKIPAGVKGPFMLAAPPLGFECHHPLKRTVPCLSLLKGCTLACPWCRFKRQFTVYVPLFDMTAAKHFKLVITGGKKTFADAQKLAVGDVVSVLRGTLERDTVRLRPWMGETNPSVLGNWKKKLAEDISLYLFHLWQYRPLTEHFRQRYYPSLRTLGNTPHPDALKDEDGAPIGE